MDASHFIRHKKARAACKSFKVPYPTLLSGRRVFLLSILSDTTTGFYHHPHLTEDPARLNTRDFGTFSAYTRAQRNCHPLAASGVSKSSCKLQNPQNLTSLETLYKGWLSIYSQQTSNQKTQEHHSFGLVSVGLYL